MDQSRLNYEEQNQYKICVQFFNETQFIEQSFLIEIEDINEPPYNLHCSRMNIKIIEKIKKVVFFLLFRSNRILYSN